MNGELQARLAALPPLSGGNVQSRICKICAAGAPLFDVVDFNKLCSQAPYAFGAAGVAVDYYRCNVCGFIFTPFMDDWSPQEFARFIYNSDYLKVDGEYAAARPLRLAQAVAGRMRGYEGLRILDYGSGSGVFSQELARHGFGNVASYDPYSSPFKPDGQFDLVTCFEVIEHSPHPSDTLAQICGFLAADGTILLETGIQPANIGELGARWWYIAPRNGHISIFSTSAMRRMANKAGLICAFDAGSFLLARRHFLHAFAHVSIDGAELSNEVLLQAPAPAESRQDWHGPEDLQGMAYRWSARSGLVWQDQFFPAGQVIIRIPFIMEVEPGFAGRCRILMDGKKIAAEVEDGAIVARAQLAQSAACNVQLCTPEPICPSDRGWNADLRSLGLAVPLAR